jgi:HK97 family phage major capsid protein
MAKRIVELRQRLTDLQAKGGALLKKAEDDDRDLTEAEAADFERITLDIEQVKAEIGKLEKMADRRDALGVIRTVPANDRITDEPNPETTAGFRDVAEFAVAVRGACRSGGSVIDQRLMAAPTNFHTGGAASGEGYEVPMAFRDQIFEIVQSLDEFGALVDEEPTNAREVKGLADESTPWGATGVTANWRSEGTQMTASKLSTEPRTTPLHELYAFVTATEELLEDAPRLASRVTRKAAEAIAWKRNDALIWGTGAGQPLGWMNSPALVSIAKEGSQVADSLDDQNILKMFARLLVVPGDRPIWIANRDTVPQLMTLQIGDKPMWVGTNGLVDAPNGILMGYPVRFTEHARTLGDKGDIMLVSPKGYYAARRTSGPQFAQSMHLFFDYAVQAFRWMFRFGGQPHLSAAVSPANGASTKSHFVTLDERA